MIQAETPCARCGHPASDHTINSVAGYGPQGGQCKATETAVVGPRETVSSCVCPGFIAVV